MRAIIINSSPKKEFGNTALIANPFVEQLKDLGVDMDYFYTYDLEIKPCLGCLKCLRASEIKCIQDDDMNSFLKKYSEADIKIFIFPVYTNTLPGQLKKILDRSLSILKIDMELRNNKYKHSVKESFNPGKYVIISSCNYWSKDNFKIAVDTLEAIADDLKEVISGVLLRPHSSVFRYMFENNLESVFHIIQASKDAACELFKDGYIRKKTEDNVSQDLLSEEDYGQIMINSEKI